MNNDKKTLDLPSITKEFLHEEGVALDNVFADIWKSLAIPSLLNRLGFNKRTGTSAGEVVYLLLMWVWLKTDSIYMFSRSAMQSFTESRKDALYDFLKREDVDWRTFNLQVAKKVYVAHKLSASKYRAFILDDSVKIRRGKKMAGISSHFDHLTGRTVNGEQVLTLGYATEDNFLSLDSDIFISKKPLATSVNHFKDKRSIPGKRYKDAVELTKPQMAAKMVKRASRSIQADYLLADAWFGNKPTLRMALDNHLTPILRMKKCNTKYLIPRWR